MCRHIASVMHILCDKLIAGGVLTVELSTPLGLATSVFNSSGNRASSLCWNFFNGFEVHDYLS